MEFWHGFLPITGIHILAAISPGPNFIFVSQQTTRRRNYLYLTRGVGLGRAYRLLRARLGGSDRTGFVVAHGD